MGDKDLQKKKKKKTKTENKKFPVRNLEHVEKGRKSNTDMETIKNQPREKTKRKRERGKNVGIDNVVQMSTEADTSIKTTKKEKVTKSPRKNKFMSVENSNSLVGQADQFDIEIGDGFDEQNGELKKARKKKRKVQNSTKEDMKLLEKRDWNQVSHVSSAEEDCLEGKLKKNKRKKRREHDSSKEAEKSQKEEGGADKSDVYLISSGDEDSSKGMKKWVTEYHQSRQGIEILQQTIDEFLTAHEEQLEKERKEREALAAEGGWTVVTHHKGRKKTTDAESGVTVGSVAQAVVEEKMAKKKQKEVGLNFYRFQRKEAQRNEIMMLQSKFEQDKKRIQQLRAARKFRPY